MKKKRKPMSKRKRARQRSLMIKGALVLGLILVIGLAGYLALRSSVNKVAKDTICDNIYIEDVDVSGMKAKEAKAALEAKVAEYRTMAVTLTAEEANAEVLLSDLGFEVKNIDKLVEKAVSYGKEGSVWSRYSQMKDLEDQKKVFHAAYKVDAEAVATTIATKNPHLEN